jgi:hypothetical protein
MQRGLILQIAADPRESPSVANFTVLQLFGFGSGKSNIDQSYFQKFQNCRLQ